MKTRGGLTALAWKDRREVYMLINMGPTPAEGNFCEYSNRPLKPHIMERYNSHKGYVDNSDHTANRYLKNWHTFKCTMKLSFHLLHLTILNRWILLSSCRAKYTHWDFRLLLVSNLIEEAGNRQDHATPDWLEDQVRPQQTLCDSRAAITKSGQWNQQPNSAIVCVLLVARERAQCINVPDVMWACVWCLVLPNITPESICKSPPFWILCAVTKQWSKVPQTFCSNQNYVRNELFTPHFI